VAARTAIEAIVGAVDRYKEAHDALPESLTTLTEGDEPLLRELKPDPWGNPFALEVSDDAFTVVSHAADGAEGGEGPAHDVRSDGWKHEDAVKKVAKAHEDHAKKVEEGKAEAKRLTERFAPWYYVIPDESFKTLRPPRAELVKAKSATDDEGDESDEEEGEDDGADEPFDLPIGG